MNIKVNSFFNKNALKEIQANIYNARFSVYVEDTSGRNNTEIAAIHEFGSISKGIPKRSFIIDPIMLNKERLTKYVSRYFFVFKRIKKSVADLVAEELYNIIQDAFETGGFGTWQELKLDTIKRKGNSNILIDTSELRHSIKIRIDKL